MASEVVIVKLAGLHGQDEALAVLAAPLAILLQADAGDAGFRVAGDGPLLLVLVSEMANEAARLEAHVFSRVGAFCVHGADFDGAVADAAHDFVGVYVRVGDVIGEVEGHFRISISIGVIA